MRRCLLFALLGLRFAHAAEDPGCDSTIANAREARARAAEDRRSYEEALAELRAAFAVCPSQRTLLLDISRLSALRRDYPGAIASAQEFLHADPGSLPGKTALAHALFMSQKFGDARALAREVLRVSPSDRAALRVKGNAEYLLGDVAAATATFVKLLELYPSDDAAAYMLGRIYYQEGSIELAMGQFERALRLAPDSYKALQHLGLCYHARGDTDRAVRYLLAAIAAAERQEPRYDTAHADLAEVLLKSGDAQKAYDAAAKAADRNPLSARNFYLGGKALHEIGNIDLALNWLQRSAALDETYPEPWYLLARIYRKAGNEQDAAKALDRFRTLSAAAPARRR